MGILKDTAGRPRGKLRPKNIQAKGITPLHMRIDDKINQEVVNFFGTLKRAKDFLLLLSQTSSVAAAAIRMNKNPIEVKNLLAAEEDYAKLAHSSLADSKELLQSALYERLVSGEVEVVYGENKQKIGEKKKFNVRGLLDFLKLNQDYELKKSNPKRISQREVSTDIDLGEDFVVPKFDE